MTSLFKPSSETARTPIAKVLLWGPSGAGKTHFMMGAPGLALLDVETRARSFAVRREFQFIHAELPELADFAAAVKEVRRGDITCETIGVDSGSAVYLKLVEEHTRMTERGGYVTDWVVVNRRFLASLNFVFSVVGKNVIYTMHSAPKLIRQGTEFRAAGEHLVGDERLRFGFDYVLRIEPDGDPAKRPAKFHVEKTASPALPVGAVVRGLTWQKFRELCGSAEPPAALAVPAVAPARVAVAGEAPASQSAPPDEPIGQDQHRQIVEIASKLAIGTPGLADLCKAVSRRTPMVGSLTAAEATRLLAVLERRLAEIPRKGERVAS